jgi:hypothetical protein
MIQLYNQLGELVLEEKLSSDITEINTGLFTNGIYLLSIKTPEGISSKKVVISH